MSIVCLAYNTLVSIVCLAYNTLVDMDFDELLEQVDGGETDVVESHINERLQDMSKELLGIVSALEDGMLSTSGMAPHDGRCGELHLGMDSCLGSSPSLPH